MILHFENKNNFNDLKLYIDYLTKFIKEYEWLINRFLVEFYIDDSWNKLPKSWKEYLVKLEPIHLSQFLNYKKISLNIVQPLSFICFKKCGQIFSFSRNESNQNELDNFLKRIHKQNKDYNIFNLNTMDLKYVFTKHLKLKKRHEVSKFANFINNLVCSKSIKLVDFGSGQGHLDRLLALNFNFDVITIEAEKNNSERASQHDIQAIKYLSNKFYNKNKEIIKKPKHLILKLNNIKSLNLNFDSDKVGLIGLHSCGDLSVNMLKIFANNLGKHLFLFSCCYHKCSNDKIPISNYVKKKKIDFSFELKEIACHSIENYIEKLKDNYISLKIYCYRALLEYIFHTKYSKFKNIKFSKVRRFEKMSFEEYFQASIQNYNFNLNEKDLINDDIQQKLNSYSNVIKFYILRLYLAPILENLIQVDRILFLNENNNKIFCYLIPLFNAKLSPRNFLLYCFKI